MGTRSRKRFTVMRSSTARPGTFVFRSTAYPIGRSHANLASLLKVKIDDEEVRVVGAKWRVTSRLESNNLGRWFVPQIDLIGKFGSPNGPSLAEARVAKALRIALKTGAEPPALEAHKTPSPGQVAAEADHLHNRPAAAACAAGRGSSSTCLS